MNYSSFDYYRTSIPGWGTTQFQFRAPPAPAYYPLPTWSGWDYYRAHTVNPDANLYYTVMNRTRDFGPESAVGMHEARIWQRRVYSGIVNLSQILPTDIGVAAAYEAYRYWKHHNRVLFGPLDGNAEREKEALVGLALAEANTLWQMSGRHMDAYGLRDCLESAALTATRMAFNILEERSAEYDASYGSRRRRYSTATLASMRDNTLPGDVGFGETSFSNAMPIPGRVGSGSSGGYGAGGSPFGTAATLAMPVPGTGNSPYNATAALPYGTPNMPMTGTSPYNNAYAGAGMTGASPLLGGMQYGQSVGATYPAGYQPVQVPYGRSSPNPYPSNAMAMQQQVPFTGGHSTYSQAPQVQVMYPDQQTYANQAAGPTTTIIANGRAIPAPAGSTVVIDTGRQRSRRTSHSDHKHERSHHRSRSVDPSRRDRHYTVVR